MNSRKRQPRFLLARDPEAGRSIVEILDRLGIAAFVDGVPLVVDGVSLVRVGLQAADFVRARLHLLERARDVVVVGSCGEEPILDRAGAASGLLEELGFAGADEAAIADGLARYYARSGPNGRRRALEALDLLGGEGARRVEELLEIACGDEGPEERLWELAAFLAGRPGAGVARLVGLLRDPRSATRARAAMALGKLGDPSAVPALVRLYTDPSPAVQAEAGDAVWRLARVDDGFDPDLPDEEKRRIQAGWS